MVELIQRERVAAFIFLMVAVSTFLIKLRIFDACSKVMK